MTGYFEMNGYLVIPKSAQNFIHSCGAEVGILGPPDPIDDLFPLHTLLSKTTLSFSAIQFCYLRMGCDFSFYQFQEIDEDKKVGTIRL